MGFLDKILKKKQKSNEVDDLLDKIEDFDNVYSSNNIESNNKSTTNLNNDDIDLDTMDLGDDEDDKPKSKKQLPKLNFGLDKNSKKTKTIAGVVIACLSLYLVSPFIVDALKTQGIMSNSEYEETIQEVNELSSQNDNPELLAKMEAEEKERIEKAKAAREAKKLKKEQEAKSNETTSNETKEKTKQLEVVKEEPKSIENPLENKVVENTTTQSEQAKLVRKEVKEDIKVVEKPIVKEELAEGTNYVGKDGHIKQEKIEKAMENQFNASIKKIESSDLEHDINDKLDPFALEYSGTINSKAMSNELNENVKLMREYIAFLETKKTFEEAKLTFEKEKRKNIFEQEVNKVKDEFLLEMDGMKKEFEALKQENKNLNSQLKNNSANNEIENLKKLDDEIANRTLELNSDVSQKVYKIGFDYLLEETDSEGNIKVYRDGNAYKGFKIIQITPEFLKVKQESGKVSILSINEENNTRNNYAKVNIPTPKKIEVENEDSGSSTSSTKNSKQKVENYSNVQNKNRENSMNEQKNVENNREQQLKSRFLN
jgi:hypothetical protein